MMRRKKEQEMKSAAEETFSKLATSFAGIWSMIALCLS